MPDLMLFAFETLNQWVEYIKERYEEIKDNEVSPTRYFYDHCYFRQFFYYLDLHLLYKFVNGDEPDKRVLIHIGDHVLLEIIKTEDITMNNLISRMKSIVDDPITDDTDACEETIDSDDLLPDNKRVPEDSGSTLTTRSSSLTSVEKSPLTSKSNQETLTPVENSSLTNVKESSTTSTTRSQEMLTYQRLLEDENDFLHDQLKFMNESLDFYKNKCEKLEYMVNFMTNKLSMR